MAVTVMRSHWRNGGINRKRGNSAGEPSRKEVAVEVGKQVNSSRTGRPYPRHHKHLLAGGELARSQGRQIGRCRIIRTRLSNSGPC